MTEDDLLSYTRTEGWLGHTIVAHRCVGSTNNLAVAAATQGVTAGYLVIADVQTAGRGRMQRAWLAPAGSSLLFSIVFRPPQPFTYYAFRTTMAVGLALLDAVKSVARGIKAQLKWPNDVIVMQDVPGHPTPGWAKLAGVLSEVVLSEAGTPDALAVGVGLNVNVPVEDLAGLGPQAVSLQTLTGQMISRVALLDGLLSAAEERIDALHTGHDPFPEWRCALAWLGHRVEIVGPTETLIGIAQDVDADGALLVRQDEGELRRFSVGDVSLRLPVLSPGV